MEVPNLSLSSFSPRKLHLVPGWPVKCLSGMSGMRRSVLSERWPQPPLLILFHRLAPCCLPGKASWVTVGRASCKSLCLGRPSDWRVCHQPAGWTAISHKQGSLRKDHFLKIHYGRFLWGSDSFLKTFRRHDASCLWSGLS